MPGSRPGRKTHSVSATIGDQTYEQLVALCQAEDTSIARIIRRALGEFLDARAGASAALRSPRRQNSTPLS